MKQGYVLKVSCSWRRLNDRNAAVGFRGGSPHFLAPASPEEKAEVLSVGLCVPLGLPPLLPSLAIYVVQGVRAAPPREPGTQPLCVQEGTFPDSPLLHIQWAHGSIQCERQHDVAGRNGEPWI